MAPKKKPAVITAKKLASKKTAPAKKIQKKPPKLALGRKIGKKPTVGKNAGRYRLVKKNKSWQDAAAYCKRNKLGHLVIIPDAKRQKALESYLKKVGGQ